MFFFRYTTRKPELSAEPVFYKKGSGQLFDLADFKITPEEFQPAEVRILQIALFFVQISFYLFLIIIYLKIYLSILHIEDERKLWKILYKSNSNQTDMPYAH